MSDGIPILDGRSSDEVVRDLLTLLPGYVPDWLLTEGDNGDAGWTLAQIFARFVEVLGERLNRAPDKAKLAFLDWLGMSLIPAQAARAPVVFQLLPNARDSRAPAQTQLGAKVVGSSTPLVFQTETPIGLAVAKLAQVISLHPGSDTSADHSAAVANKQPFSLFTPLQPTAHSLYIAHDLYFRLSGRSTVEIDFELAEAGQAQLNIVWEYWDGTLWQGFKSFADHDDVSESYDNTRGLTHSGSVRLVAECAETQKRSVNNIQANWVRGRLNDPLPPAAQITLPLVDRIQISSVIDRSLPSKTDCKTGIAPEAAFADGQKLDLSKAFQPLGQNPQLGSAFYVACEEAFSKPGAEVTLCLTRSVLPQEQADSEVAKYEVTLQAAQDYIRTIKTAAELVVTLLQNLPTDDLRADQTPLFDQDMNAWYANVFNRVNDARERLGKQLPDALRALQALVEVAGASLINVILSGGLGGIFLDPALAGIATSALFPMTDVLLEMIRAIEQLSVGTSSVTGTNKTIVDSLEALKVSLAAARNGIPAQIIGVMSSPANILLIGMISNFANGITPIWPLFLDANFPAFTTAETRYQDLKDRINRARDAVTRANTSAASVVQMLTDLSPVTMAAAAGILPPILPGPTLAWEYWNGSQWQALSDLNDTLQFQTSGLLTFSVPDDWETTMVNQVVGRWLRTRLAEGSYNKLRIVTWRDSDGDINALPVLENRPPTLDAFSLGYVYRSAQTAPEHCLAYNDFQYADVSEIAAWVGESFAPYRPIADITPSLYLGFDQLLPSDRIGLYLDFVEQEGKTSGPPLVWEYWDGLEWREISVEDETASLRLPGMLAFTGAADSAPFARFGTPCHWLRGRLREVGDPVDSRANAFYLNAVWASQWQTLNHEILGSSNGQAKQSFFFSHTPVLEGQIIEVLELQGARAEVELPILQREFLRKGYHQSEIDTLLRTVIDSRSGRIREVWVRWDEKPHLLFSGATDRHYMIERSSGRLIFGDDQHGRTPPAGMNNIAAQTYRAGGGVTGNVPAGSINQLLGMITSAQSVVNPRQAEGGANNETLDSIRTRGPRTVRNHAQAVRLVDYETLARQASPAVAISRAMLLAPGRISVIIVPNSTESRPQPSFELRHEVQAYLAMRAPAALAGQIIVRGADYLLVDVEVTVAPINAEDPGPVRERVLTALQDFLHPLTGGPEHSGWGFGRDVYLSDLAVIVERVEGVDYAESLILLLDDTPQGERLIVPSARMVAAGTLRVLVRAAEQT